MSVNLCTARIAAINSLEPYKKFKELTGFYPGEFPFNAVRDVAVIELPRNWAEVLRAKEILILNSLDLSHEPNTERRPSIVGKSKPERFAIEDL